MYASKLTGPSDVTRKIGQLAPITQTIPLRKLRSLDLRVKTKQQHQRTRRSTVLAQERPTPNPAMRRVLRSGLSNSSASTIGTEEETVLP